ncbi:MAG: SH3 domain-containing protein [Acetatifactor sp.]|nr:SH3 domain-containing protein [Acetatifactor sp.]MDE7352024.1 SH3 domain-containing protein [Acetatifactor sp.]
MKIGKYISAILIITVMLFACACGNQAGPVSTEPTETVKETDTEENPEEGIEESTEESQEESTEGSTGESAEKDQEESIEESAGESEAESQEESVESSEVVDNSEKEADATKEESRQDSEYEIISIDDTVMYAARNCNIRSGAGTQYDKVGRLSYAQEVIVNGKAVTDEDNLWYVIKTDDGSIQMVSADMLSKTKPAPQTVSVSSSGSGSNSEGSTGDTGNSNTESAPAGNSPAQNTPANSDNTGALYQCECGFQTADYDTMAQHTVNHIVDSIPVPAPTQPAPTQPTPVPTPAPSPAHEHVWKEHTVTTQVWIREIVVVADYDDQRVCVGTLYQCNCGFETTDSAVQREHGKAHVLNDEMDNFMMTPIYEGEIVYIGSHEEERGGHYEDTTYVDYYYCDCGATK